MRSSCALMGGLVLLMNSGTAMSQQSIYPAKGFRWKAVPSGGTAVTLQVAYKSNSDDLLSRLSPEYGTDPVSVQIQILTDSGQVNEEKIFPIALWSIKYNVPPYTKYVASGKFDDGTCKMSFKATYRIVSNSDEYSSSVKLKCLFPVSDPVDRVILADFEFYRGVYPFYTASDIACFRNPADGYPHPSIVVKDGSDGHIAKMKYSSPSVCD